MKIFRVSKGCSITGIMKQLGLIDRDVSRGRISKGQHNTRTRAVLKKCLRVR